MSKDLSIQAEAVAALWDEAQPSVSLFIRASVRDYHAAEDILQDVAGIVVSKFDRYDSRRPFGAWAMGIARNCVLRHYRNASRNRILFDADLLELMSQTYERMSDEKDLYETALHSCLNKLAGRSRKAIELKYVEELSGEEIAEEMHIKPTAARVLLHRVRQLLRSCVDQTVGQMQRPRNSYCRLGEANG